MRGGQQWVRFKIHPRQYRRDLAITSEAAVVDRRVVTDSGGHDETRYVIVTLLALGGREWPIEMTLAGRDDMRFRMLLGRSALRGRAIVDPSHSYLTRRPRRRER